MRYGFTTGSCSVAASKAATYMLLTGKTKHTITIMTPKQIPYEAELVDICKEEQEVSCAVVKDGGDDPDVTTGLKIYATVRLLPQEENGTVIICGGSGVGIVTKPGLDQPVGEAAINHVPREQICKEVGEVCKSLDYQGGIQVTISVPGGEEVAKKTFNERLGIVGGISIIGTSGIVEPMSSQAILDTIRVELNQKKELGLDMVCVSPGNYGQDYMKKTFGFDLDESVKCSNFIGDTIDMVREFGFKKMLFTGHIGKLVKISGGIMNTHSKEGDCRMELMTASAIRTGSTAETAKEILSCVSTEEAIEVLRLHGGYDLAMQDIMKGIMKAMNRRSGDDLQIECMMYANQYGMLAESEHAKNFLEEWRRKWSIL